MAKKIMDTIANIILFAVFFALAIGTTIVVTEYRNAPVKETYMVSWNVIDGVCYEKTEDKDMEGTMTMEAAGYISDKLDVMLTKLDGLK